MQKPLVVSVALALCLAPAMALAGPRSWLEQETTDENTTTLVDEILVDLKDDLSDSDALALARDVGLTDMAPNSAWGATHGKLQLAHVDPADMGRILAKLSSDPRVERAEPQMVMHELFVPNDPLYKDQWHMPKVGAETAWDYTCGAGVTVAVVDTGVACFDRAPFKTVSDLKGTACGGGWNFVHDNEYAYDDEGHGTHVAGTIAQTTDNGTGVSGLAHCAKVMPVKVLNSRGSGTVADVAEGIRWAADNGAQIINLSLGGNIASKVLKDAVDHAIAKGVVVIAAAGNSGKSIGWPAKYAGVIAVGATDSNDQIAFFSSRGPELAIAAPGVKVVQQTICDNGRNACEQFGAFSGTSMASPHVAGAAALLVGLGVTDASHVRSMLTSTAVPKGEPEKYGAGILDIGAATSHVYMTHLMIRLFSLVLLALGLKAYVSSKKGEFRVGPAALFTSLFAGVGLLAFAPFVGLASILRGSSRTFLELAMRPFGEWDLVLNANLHQWLPLASVLPVAVLVALGFRSDRLRPAIGGFALGTAALCTQIAVSADAAAPFGSVALRIWMVANIALCLGIARLSLDAKTRA